MTKETMTVHEALMELKLLDKRIDKKIDDSTFCINRIASATKVNGVTIEEMKGRISDDWQSVNSLLARRAALRNAVAQSNGKTLVNICGRDYTVSEAIEMKDRGILLKEDLLEKLSGQYNYCVKMLTANNERLESDANDYVTKLFGTKDKVNAADIAAAREAYIKAKTTEIVDPLDLKSKIEKLQEEIDVFRREVSAKLSVSNALTTVTIEY